MSSILSGGAALLGGGLDWYSNKRAGDAAENASNAQIASADRSNQLQYQMFQEQMSAMEPWRQSGYNALAALNSVMGLPGIDPYSPYSTRTGSESRTASTTPRGVSSVTPSANAFSPYAGPDLSSRLAYDAAVGDNENYTSYVGAVAAALRDGTWMRDSAGRLVPAGSAADAATTRDRVLPPTGSTSYVWSDGSTHDTPEDGFSASTGRSTATDYSLNAFVDPSYEWRKSQGQDALMANANAQGLYGSGNLGTALVDYGQNAASQEYQNVYNRLAALSGTGQVQTQQMANLGQQLGQTMGNNYVGMGNAQAAGIVGQQQARAGQYNAFGDMFSGGMGAVFGYPSYNF